jgi:hypothetical protein
MQLNELQTWWQNMTPQMQAALQEGGLVLVALLGGQFLGTMVARTLRGKKFDAALRLPGSAPVAPEAEHGIGPTMVAGLLVRLTIWAGAAWWLAHKHDRVDLANTLGLIINRTWALATVLVAALALGSMLARRLMDCLRDLPGAASRNAAAAPKWNVAGAVGAVVYVVSLLLVLLITADLFDWPLTRTSALALWQFAQHLMIAGAALLIGSLGARWARDLVTPEGPASLEVRAGQYTGLGIIAATTVLAVAVLLSGAGLIIGLAALAVLGFVLWMVRGYLPDITAGLQLRVHKVQQVWFEGTQWNVSSIGLLTAQVGRAGEFWQLQNRRLLEACLHGAPAEASAR